jgi:hypothetical protein
MKFIVLEQNKMSIMSDESTPVHDKTILLGLLENCKGKSVRSTFLILKCIYNVCDHSSDLFEN